MIPLQCWGSQVEKEQVRNKPRARQDHSKDGNGEGLRQDSGN